MGIQKSYKHRLILQMSEDCEIMLTLFEDQHSSVSDYAVDQMRINLRGALRHETCSLVAWSFPQPSFPIPRRIETDW